MKFKSVLKVLGAAALAAGVTPYKVSKDEESGEVKATALLWNAAYTPATGDADKKVVVNFGLNVPGKGAEDEAHLYTDDVTVSYAAAGEAPAGEEAPAAEEAPAEEPAAEEAAPEVTEEAPAEPAEETPAEETDPNPEG